MTGLKSPTSRRQTAEEPAFLFNVIAFNVIIVLFLRWWWGGDGDDFEHF